MSVWSITNVVRFRRLVPLVLIVLLLLTLANDVWAQGGLLTYGANAIGSLSAQAPLAFYVFNGSAGDQITVHVAGISPGMLPGVSLLSPTQQQLASNANDPYGSGDGTEARLTFRLPVSGIYTLLVSNTAGTPGDFLIRLRGRPAEASPGISPEGPTVADVAPGGLSQAFSFTASPNGPTTLIVATDTPGFAFTIQVRDSTGQLVAVLTSGDLGQVSFVVGAGEEVYEVII